MARAIVNYQDSEYSISYVFKKQNTNEVILFLHGWGDRKETHINTFLPYFDHSLLFVDLPGFGSSSCVKALSSFDYANILKIFLKQCLLNLIKLIFEALKA